MFGTSLRNEAISPWTEEPSEKLTNDNVSIQLLSCFPSAGPYTEYRIIVIAFTLKYDGEPSEPVIQRTDIAGPSAPQIINLTCHSQDALYLQWKRPTTFYNSIDLYVINYKESTYNTYQSIQVNTTSSFAESAVSTNILIRLRAYPYSAGEFMWKCINESF